MTALSSVSYGECSESATKLLSELSYRAIDEPKDKGRLPSLQECKVWSFDSNKTIITLAVFQNESNPPATTEVGGHKEGLYDLDVLMMDTETGKLLHRVLQKGILYSDAEYLSHLAIDTGKYDLAQGVRAFGVRVSNSHSGGVSSEVVTLGLFAIHQGKLKAMSDRILVRRSVANSVGYDCYDVKIKERSVSMRKKSTNGFADLIVSEKQENTKARYINNVCSESTEILKARYVVRFDGERYLMPARLKE